MGFASAAKTVLDRRGLRWILAPLASDLARRQNSGVLRIDYADGVWLHHTEQGWFAYNEPFIRLNLRKLDDYARYVFCWGYTPRPGEVIVDIGAGVGEEALTFSNAVGERGKVIAVEAHPGTFRCLKKMVQYNHLENVIPIHAAIAGPSSTTATIEDSRRYLRNRLGASRGISVPSITIDALCRRIGLGRIHFLKMNIEGAERYAIQGMAETLRQTEVLCICCHDFLAQSAHDSGLETRRLVQEFLLQGGITVMPRTGSELPPYLRDQIWGYNPLLMRAAV